MLHEQEMQFADPDWKPTQPLQMPSTPLDVDSSWSAAQTPTGTGQGNAGVSSASASTYGQGYQGLPPQQSFAQQPLPTASSTTYQYPYQAGKQYGRGRNRWWLWAILVLICIVLGSGVFQATSRGYAGLKHSGMVRPMPARSDTTFIDPKGATQLSINDLSGDITVQVNTDNDQNIAVSSSDGSAPQVNYQGRDMSLTADGNGPITITIPQNIALSISAGENNIDVEGFSGQLIAQTGNGAITLNGDELGQGSALNTNSGAMTLEGGTLSASSITSTSGSILLNGVGLSGNTSVSTGGNGSITYSGTLDDQGTYQFSTASGAISLTLPLTTAMKLNVSQKSGHYSSNFPASSGKVPEASVKLTTESGDISINGQ